ncbi:MAG: DUF2812 domain-containing protein [Eubacteriales bacterium]
MTMKKYFTAYRKVVPAEYEKWFEDLAADGWHPKKINHFSSMVMKFEKKEPKKYKYAIELLGKLSKERIQTYKDFGWEYVGRMSSIFVWRSEYLEKKPEMFTDSESTKKRSNRFILAISFSFTAFLVALITTLVLAILGLAKVIEPDWLQIILGIALSGILTIYLGFVMRKISKNKYK